ncbi:Uncharacterised protein [Vibrio cholerae]|uniref:Uncharacterized protein n=1 Tax=Vibrio cholerae TaxID=666 RepID=A0A655ZX54_VIBCL|nr:Uncharacterised protein [Vibrio cholerae]CSC95356.1 Uncharacterised protein [Vibrio cholerae]
MGRCIYRQLARRTAQIGTVSDLFSYSTALRFHADHFGSSPRYRGGMARQLGNRAILQRAIHPKRSFYRSLRVGSHRTTATPHQSGNRYRVSHSSLSSVNHRSGTQSHPRFQSSS